MGKKFTIISTGAAAIALAAVFGTSGLFSNTSSAASSQDNSAKDTVTADKAKFCKPVDFQQMKTAMSAIEDSVKLALADLVKAGTITQEQADLMLPSKAVEKLDMSEAQRTAFESAAEKAKVSALEGLVSSGVLTQAEADAMSAVRGEKGFTANSEIMDKLKTAMESATKTALGELVNSGLITQEIADSLAIKHERGKESAKPQLTAEQSAGIKTAMENARKAAVDALILDGTLTKEQAEKFANMKPGKAEPGKAKPGSADADKAEPGSTDQMMPGKMMHGHMMPGQMSGLSEEKMDAVAEAMSASMKTALNDLVTSGVFTQDEADKLMPKFEKRAAPNFSDEQSSAVKSAIDNARTAALDKLVSDGKLTQEEADNFKDCGPGMGGKDGPGMGGRGGNMAGKSMFIGGKNIILQQ